jgi:hypothetical protein
MADDTLNKKRTRLIAALSLFFSLIGLLLLIFLFDIVFFTFCSFPFGALGWVFAREIKSTILTILGVVVTFGVPIVVMAAFLYHVWLG